jgi:hypothetical protein
MRISPFSVRRSRPYLRTDLLNIASAFCAAASALCAAASARLAAASARAAAASTLLAFDAQAWQAEVSTFSGEQQPVASVSKLPTSRGAPNVLNSVLIDTLTSFENRQAPIPQTTKSRKMSFAGPGPTLLQKRYQGLKVRALAADSPRTSIGDTAGITLSTPC